MNPKANNVLRPNAVNIHLQVDDDIHRRMKVAAARMGLKLWEGYEAALECWLRQVEKTS